MKKLLLILLLGGLAGGLATAIYGSTARRILGTPRADVLKGTPAADTIDGRAGNDKLSGLGGNDLLIGGSGNDRLTGGPGTAAQVERRRHGRVQPPATGRRACAGESQRHPLFV
jgi:hypothetical protein